MLQSQHGLAAHRGSVMEDVRVAVREDADAAWHCMKAAFCLFGVLFMVQGTAKIQPFLS